MRLLFLSPRQCWPPITGARLREYYFLRALGERMEVVYLFFHEPNSPVPSAADLPFCAEAIAVTKPMTYGMAKLLRGLAGRQPLPILNYTSKEMAAAIRNVLGRHRFDLIQVESIHMAGYQPLLGAAAPVFYDWHNIESEAMRRYSLNSRFPAKKLYSHITAKQLLRVEREILGTAAGHLVCSGRERTQLITERAQARIAVIENGVDTTYFAETAAAKGKRHRIVFVGSMDYHANADVAIGFARDIWPGIHKRFPDWVLTLVGSNPGPAVLALRQFQNVEVTGTVPDVRPYYREALASIVPLRVGGGTRLKILEAMAAGVPVVSTTLGVEGLDVVPGRHILIADDHEAWLPLLESLAVQHGRREHLVQSALARVESRYDWRLLGTKLCDTYLEWLMPGASSGEVPC
jgi:sugar transferase (PEP-CTERM/EpsH1 system associated)